MICAIAFVKIWLILASGIGLEKVAILAGHESLETTKIYCYPTHADSNEAVERISEEE